MTCAFCSLEFSEEEARKSACSRCGRSGGCGMIRCPRCGYEAPVEPDWIKRLKRWMGGRP